MALAAGARVGPYEVLALLGSGGMGQVYRARDSKLNREVAIKVLRDDVANDQERLVRFGREAQVLAALNHPSIAHIYGIEETTPSTASGQAAPAIVMELVEGPTLADRLAHGAIPIEDALPIAKQVAEALEAAHEQGIVHRDLKPANIKVKDDGTVKVLDFGLAKALETAGGAGADATRSPTVSVHGTHTGVILGTAAYMAPEQARGRPVGPRADIWAFGCVWFEMLAGTRAFKGKEATDTIVAVLSQEPDWEALPQSASRARSTIARCLKKDPKQRLQAIGDARILIDELIGGAAEAGAETRARVPGWSRRARLGAIAAVVGAAALGALASRALSVAPTRPDVRPSRFEIVPPPPYSLSIQFNDRNLAISPDGRYIVYRAGADLAQLVVRAIDRVEVQPLTGIANTRQPFFSPDGQWIGFFDPTLKRVSVGGGSAITIHQNPFVPRGASWAADDLIVFGTMETSTGLLRVPASGGEPLVLTRPDQERGELNHWFPSVLPGGRAVLYTATVPTLPERLQVAVFNLTDGRSKTLVRGGSQAEYVDSGHLVFASAGTIRAVRFDLERLAVMGEPVPMVERVQMAEGTAAANFAVSRSGTLAYVPALSVSRALVWVDRQGNETSIPAPLRAYDEPRLSPDGTRIAVTIRDQEFDIWIWNLAREEGLRRLTFHRAVDWHPVWTPDGGRVVYSSSREVVPNLFAQSADGTGTVERLTVSPVGQHPSSIGPSGAGVVGHEIPPTTAADIAWWLRSKTVSPSKPDVSLGANGSEDTPLVRTSAIEVNPDISPDGRYFAYQSNESGRHEIFVRPFPNANDGGIWQVSTGGGTRPVWARNGRELFYLDLANRLTAVPVRTAGSRFTFGNPVTVLERSYLVPPGDTRPYDVSADGQRFLMIKDGALSNPAGPPASIVVVLNWAEELKAKLPTGR